MTIVEFYVVTEQHQSKASSVPYLVVCHFDGRVEVWRSAPVVSVSCDGAIFPLWRMLIKRVKNRVQCNFHQVDLVKSAIVLDFIKMIYVKAESNKILC